MIAGALALAATAATARPLDDVRASGYLRVALYRTLKPFSYIENDKPKGVDVEIAERLAAALGVRTQFFMIRSGESVGMDLRNGVSRGSVLGEAPGDVMLHVPYDKSLEAANDLVKLFAPYHEDGLAIATAPEKADAARDFSLFAREKAAVDFGSLADYLLMTAKDQAYLPNVLHHRGVEQAFAAFERGEASAVFGVRSEIEPLAAMSRRPVVVVAPPPSPLQDRWVVGVAVRFDARDLGYEIADEMERLRESGELARIFQRFGVTLKSPARPE